MANVASGELAVYLDGRKFVFRPSFRALAAFGTPDELQRAFDRVQGAKYANLLPFACAMLACMCDDDIEPLIGCWEDRDGKLSRVPGRLPDNDIVVLGIKATINAIAGDRNTARRFKPSSDDKPKSATFDPAEFAAAAMVHLGLSNDDAWNMTMHDFQRALAIKFPDAVADLPSQDEYKAAIATVKNIRERAKNG